MPERTLTNRQLNRTHLRRQHLLERSSMSTGDMLREIVGVQAQEVKDPYLGLWCRIANFEHEQLASMLLDRSAVRASLMRGTIHLVTAEDYEMLFPVTYALHLRAVHSVASAKLVPPEHHAAITAQARELLSNEPLTAAQIGEKLADFWPGLEARSLSQIVRFLLPLIQTPPRGVWGAKNSSRPAWTMPDSWLGVEILEKVAPPHEMIRRYLNAFGPATLPDITAWSGVTNLKTPLMELGEEVVTYKDESGKVLYDLAGLEIVPEDAAAPVRFLPGFDNALLGHKNRTRIISDEHRAIIGTPNGMFASTFLVDGFVAGVWRVMNEQLQLVAFDKLSKLDVREVESEAERLVPFWTGAELPVVWVDPWKLPGKSLR